MQTTKILVAAACAFFLNTAAFAQTTPSPSGNNTPEAMRSSVNTQPQRGTGIRKDGTVESTNADNSSMNGNTDRKSKMNSHKGSKKTKTSTTSSSTGSM